MKFVKLLGVAAVMAFSVNAHAIVVTGTGPQGTTVVVTGIGSGSGTWAVVPAVPEAETWAMMAVGLGLVGLRLRRKNKQDVAA